MTRTFRKAAASLLAVAMGVAFAGCNVRKAQQQSSPAPSASTSTPQMASAEPYYKGKTIELVVPFAAGGGTDVYARFVAPFLEKHIEGNPKIVIKNMPGGESITGANWFQSNARPDGLTLLASSTSTMFPYLLGRPEVKYDPNKWKLVGVTATGGVLYGAPQVSNPLDRLKNPPKPLVYGGISATGLDLIPLISFEVLNLPVRSVLGMEGRGPARLAVERGETNLDYQTTSAYQTSVLPLIKEQKATPLASFGVIGSNGSLERDPVVKDVMHVGELYEKLHGKKPDGPAWKAYLAFTAAGFAYQKAIWAPEGTPAAALEALYKGVEKMARDPEFMEKGKDAIGGYPTFVGKDVEQVVRSSMTIPDDVRKWVKELLSNKYHVKF